MYGVDANDDGRKDPYNPVDAICAAARYLKAAGGDTDLRTAIFAYNHADWYVDEVLLYANQYGKLPEALVSSLTGLTEGDRFPVAANARYADDISEREALKRSKPSKGAARQRRRRGLGLTHTSRDQHLLAARAPRWSPSTTASSSGSASRRSSATTSSCRTPTATASPTPSSATSPTSTRCRSRTSSPPTTSSSSARDADDPAPTRPRPPASRSRQRASDDAEARTRSASADDATPSPTRRRSNTEDSRDRLFALPERKHNVDRAGLTGQLDSLLAKKMPGYEPFKGYFSHVLHFDPKTMELRSLKKGSQVTAGTVLGRIGKTDELAPHVQLLDPPGRPRRAEDRPEADPRRLEAARGDGDLPRRRPGPVHGLGASASQVLLMSKAPAGSSGCSPTRGSRSTRAVAATSAPARSTAGCWRCSSTSPPAGTT